MLKQMLNLKIVLILAMLTLTLSQSSTNSSKPENGTSIKDDSTNESNVVGNF